MSTTPSNKVVRGADLETIGSLVKTELNKKQATLVSGTNIKTVNETSLLGPGNITIHDGEDGKSAYQIWLDEGNTGSEEVFLASLKGDPGESGYSGDISDLEIVTDIRKGGSSAALSATPGKSLAETLDETQLLQDRKINELGGTAANFIYGAYISGASGAEGTEVSDALYGISKEYFPARKGDVVDFVSGGHGSTTIRCLVVYDANKQYLYSWYANNTTAYTYTLTNDNTAYVRLCFYSPRRWTIYLNINGHEVFRPTMYRVGVSKDLGYTQLTPFDVRLGILRKTGSVATGSRHVMKFNVSSYVGKYIYANGWVNATSDAAFCFLDSNSDLISASVVGLGTDTSVTKYPLLVPSGTTYLMVMTSGADESEDVVMVGGYDSLKEHISEKTNVFELVGNDNMPVKSPLKYSLIPRHTYRLYVKNPNINMTGVTLGSSYSRLWIAMYVDGSITGNDVDVKIGESFKRYYEFTVASTSETDDYAMTVSMRAAKGAKQTIYIEDVTTSRYTEPYASLSQYSRIAAIGDSFTSGYYYIGNTLYRDIYKYSWIANVARRNGVEWYNFAVGGGTEASWLGKEEGYRDDSAKGLDALLAAPPCDLYFISFGSNTRSYETYNIGDIDDINDSDYTQNGDTFYGNTARIIQVILSHAPKAKIVVSCGTTVSSYTGTTVADGDLVKPRLDVIEHFGVARWSVSEDEWYYNAISGNRDNLPGNHPSFVDMSGQAVAMERRFSDVVRNYRSYFENHYDSTDFMEDGEFNPNHGNGKAFQPGLIQAKPGKNLYDKDSAKLCPGLNSDGSYVSGSDVYYVSDFIPVTPSTNYCITRSSGTAVGVSSRYFCFYDKYGTFKSSISSDNTTVTVPAGVAYMKISAYYTSADVQVEKGTSRTTYESYNPIAGYIQAYLGT